MLNICGYYLKISEAHSRIDMLKYIEISSEGVLKVCLLIVVLKVREAMRRKMLIRGQRKDSA